MTKVLLLLGLILIAVEAFAGISVVYDFVDHHSDAKIANALSSGVSPSIAGGMEKKSFSLHPVAGETTATYKVGLPKINPGERLVLMFSAGIRDGVKTDEPEHPFDGVSFAVRTQGKEGFTTDLRETKWVDGSLDLTSWAGKQIEIVFVTMPNSNSNYDWAAFGNPRILKLSNGLLGHSNTAKTAKGIIVLNYMTGNNSVTIVPTGMPANGQADKSAITWNAPKDSVAQSLAAIPFDFTSVGATGVEIQLTDLISSIDVYKFDPQLEIVSFGPVNALVLADTPTDFQCVIKNAGEGSLDAKVEAKLSGSTSQSIGPLLPGEEKTLTWQGIKFAEGEAAASLTVSGLTSTWSGMAVKLPPMPLKAQAAEVKRLADGTIFLQSPVIRMAFLKTKTGYAAWMISAPKGADWETAATGSFGKIVTPGQDQPLASNLYPTDAKITGAAVSFTEKRQIGSSDCLFEWTFTLDPSKSKVSASSAITAGKPIDVLHFSGPTVYAGDGSFGGNKDGGLFPGLEYLLTERSSGTENAAPPLNLRTVPHPNKITIPFMAVRKGGALVSLEWDPLQKWDGVNDRPAAVFASPNFLDGQENHKMGLFAPSVPDWTVENQQIASKPYPLEAGKSLRLTADIVVNSNSSTILDAVDGWVSRHPLPEPPETGKKSYEAMDLLNQAYAKSAWDPNTNGWKHTNTSEKGTFDPMIAVYLRDQISHIPPPKRAAIEPVFKAAMEKANGNLNLDIALLTGGVADAYKRMADQANGLIAAQRADGSWPFTPDEKHSVFGKTGDSSSGHSSIYAETVLRYAVISSDPKARESGLKALGYLDTQSRPEGAQTWELQLHVPDILASAHLINCYLYGYQMTENKKYLDRAVYWAKSGLPFVYMWNVDDRPIMRYGTIPVFGATWFTSQPWFGVCVQWCGLEYANSLLRLSDYDKTQPWDKVAMGIMNCGIQQVLYITEKYPADAGMYPDAYSPVKGAEEYHWDLNPRLISRMFTRIYGRDAFPNTYIIKDPKGAVFALTMPVKNVHLTSNSEMLKGDFLGVPGAFLGGILVGVREPLSVQCNAVLRRAEDLSKVEEGWQYYPETTTSIFRFKSGLENTIVVDLINQYIYYPRTPGS